MKQICKVFYSNSKRVQLNSWTHPFTEDSAYGCRIYNFFGFFFVANVPAARGKVIRLTNFLVENFVKRQFIPLLQVLLHHTPDTVNIRWGTGRERERSWLHTAAWSPFNRGLGKENISKSASLLLHHIQCVIPAIVWGSPWHLSPDSGQW